MRKPLIAGVVLAFAAPLFAADPVTTLHLVLKGVQYDVRRDFVAITQVTTQPLALAVHASVPAATVRALASLA